MANNGHVGTLPDVKEPLTAEIGRSGLRSYGGVLQEDFDADLRGQRAVKTYDEMRRSDPTIAAGLRAINWILGQVNWSVQPGGETKEDREAADFLDSCLHDMSAAWSKHLRDALLCLVFGWAWCEVVYKLRQGPDADPPSRYDDGRVGWRKLSLIGHDSLSRWEFDERGGIQGLVQDGVDVNGQSSGYITIPIGKSVLYRIEDEKNNPEGTSLLRPITNAWYIKKQLQEIEAIGIERDLTGVLIIYMPVHATETDKDKARDLLEQYKADDMTGFIAPQFGPQEHERWRFDIINSPGSKSIEPGKVIQRYEVAIARSFLAQFLMLGTNTDAGSWALSRDHRGLFETALTSILATIAETMNRFLVPPLFRLNDFGTLSALPTLQPGRVSKADYETFGAALEKLVKVGLVTPDPDLEAYIRDELDLPERVETEEPETPEDTGQDEGQPATKQSPTDEETGEQEAREFAERDVELPDAEDEAQWAAWEQELQRDWDKRLGTRSLREALRFARGYDYDGRLAQYAEQFAQRMDGLVADLQSGKITPAQWEYRAKVEILTHNQQSYRVGVAKSQGVPPSAVKLTQEQRRAANTVVQDQYKYFADFAKDVRARIKAGESLDPIKARARMYGKAAKFASVMSDVAGRGDQVLRWVRRKDDSCETCISQSGKTKSAAEWYKGGVLPGVNVKCHSNCGCELLPV